jgi:hypothetical protein
MTNPQCVDHMFVKKVSIDESAQCVTMIKISPSDALRTVFKKELI